MKEKDIDDEINTSSQPLSFRNSSDSLVENIDQDKVKVFLKDFKVEFTNVSSIVPSQLALDQKEYFDIVKFSIKVQAVYDYSWEVYRRPFEIIKNFSDILSEVEGKQIIPMSQSKKIIFQNVATWQVESIERHIPEIINYYKEFFQDNQIYDTLAFKEFFNISEGSFNQYNSGNKPFEGYCYKKADPQCLRTIFSYACFCIEYFAFSQYNLRWIVVKDDMIYYMDKSNTENGKNVYFFDSDLEVTKEGRNIIKITNSIRSLILKFKTVFEREMWYKEIMNRAEANKKILKENIYQAYTNEKKGNIVQWFIDGENYFKDLSIKLLEAKVSIFITDWWLSPEVWLTRPVPMDTYFSMAYQKKNLKTYPPYSRLMDILYQCAIKGVKIYILIYDDPSILSLNSSYTKKTLETLHPNIKVEEHRSIIKDIYWSHHEKLVIIDQIIGYVGGLDLCWGRWDTHSHPIYEEVNNEQIYNFPVIDYSNARIRDFSNVHIYTKESCDREKFELRMPWHDIHCRLVGPAVTDIARHFVERWNFACFGQGTGITNIKQNTSVSKERNAPAEDEEQKYGHFAILNRLINLVNKNENEKDSKKESLINEEEEKNNKDINIKKSKNIFKKIGEKYKKKELDKNINNENKIIDNENEDSINLIDINNTNENQEELDVNAKKDTNINTSQDENKTLNQINDVNLDLNSLTKEEEEKKDNSIYNKYVKMIKKDKKLFKNIFDQSEEEKIKLENTIPKVNFFLKGIQSKVQVLRSASKWSVGIRKKENSILNAYYRLIDSSKHYIFIENQFFVSKAYSKEDGEVNEKPISDIVENMIAYKIRKRIERAYFEKQNFKVFIFIPLFPGFNGEPQSTATLQIILKHTYAGICRNHGLSIIEKLKTIMGDKWKNYIGFYSLRNHALVNNIPVTELVYIHSKLMIVDDSRIIIGSANINDRSMLGNRDSEFALLIKESKKIMIKMDGKEYKASNLAYSLRVNLFGEHLGLDPKDPILEDPLNDEFCKLVKNRANNNTMIYRKLWGCYPDDQYRSFQDLEQYKKTRNNEELKQLRNDYQKEKNNILGHIVEFPLHFLEEEELGSSFFNIEKLIPEINFT